ncbi:hypothetical protein [Morganella psychrotolerans]|uniref:hypothetical protein n=1 Tax=Morganella psychrotolerans TaxID=368603 RepID=UPI0039AFD555
MMLKKIKLFIAEHQKATTNEVLDHIYDEIMELKKQGKSWSSIMDEISYSGFYVSETQFYKFIKSKK